MSGWDEDEDEMSVGQMKQFLSSHGASFADCVEKSELRQRVRETKRKLSQSSPPHHRQQQSQQSAQSQPSQMKTCDCMQKGTDHVRASSSTAAANSSMGESKPTGAIIRQLAVGPLQCNMVIIADEVTKEGVLIDPGGDADKILALISGLGVRIVSILVTHAHFDHFLAAEEVRTATHARLHLHPSDRPLWDAIHIQCAMIGIAAPKQPIQPPDADLADGQTLTISQQSHLHCRVIHTPGHSPGSCCFYVEKAKLCFTGDTLFKGSVGRTDLMGGNSAQLIRSIQEKLYSLPPDTHCIPGHGESTNIEHEAKYNAVVRAKGTKTASASLASSAL